MLETTRTIIEAAVNADPTVTPDMLRCGLQIMEGKAPLVQGNENCPDRVLLKQGTVAQLIDGCRQTVKKLERQGRLTPIILSPGRTYTSHARNGRSYERSSAIIRYRLSEVMALARELKGDKGGQADAKGGRR